MITRIEAYRYRCFKQLNLPMKPFQVLVGPNGSGKTTLLDIPVLLGELLSSRNHSLEEAFQKDTPSHLRARTDYAGDLIFNRQGETFSLAVEARIPDDIVSRLVAENAKRKTPKAAEQYRKQPERWPGTVRYEIGFELFNDALQIAEENVLLLPRDDSAISRGSGLSVGEWAKRNATAVVPVITVLTRARGASVEMNPEIGRQHIPPQRARPTESAFAGLYSDNTQFGAALFLRDLLVRECCPYQPSLVALRKAAYPFKAPEVLPNGSSLPWLAKKLRERTPKRFAQWIRMVRLALPGVRDVETVVHEDDKHGYVRIVYDNGSKVPASGLSDGTLSILAVTILPYLPTTHQLLIHEEPENGIHPKAIEVVLESLQAITTGQVWISSHSPVVLAHSQPKDILCLSLDEQGAAVAIQGDQHPALADWKSGLDLGTLFAAGVLG